MAMSPAPAEKIGPRVSKEVLVVWGTLDRSVQQVVHVAEREDIVDRRDLSVDRALIDMEKDGQTSGSPIRAPRERLAF
jgi:hypothetical protein